MAERLFDPNGADLNVAIIRHVKCLERGDMIIFHPRTQMARAVGIRQGKKVQLFVAPFQTIRTEREFRNLVQMMGELIGLNNLAQVSNVPEPHWALRFVS